MSPLTAGRFRLDLPSFRSRVFDHAHRVGNPARKTAARQHRSRVNNAEESHIELGRKPGDDVNEVAKGIARRDIAASSNSLGRI